MAESEAEKAAAEHFENSTGGAWNSWPQSQREDALQDFEAGWNAHESRLSPPTREELRAAIDAEVRASGLDPDGPPYSTDGESQWPTARELVDRLTDRVARFSLSAPEEDWEYAVQMSGRLEELGEVYPYYVPVPPSRATHRRTKTGGPGEWLPVPAPETGEADA